MHLPRAGKAHLDILFFLLADIFQDNDPHKIEIPAGLAAECLLLFMWPVWLLCSAAGCIWRCWLDSSAEYSSDFLGPSICEKWITWSHWPLHFSLTADYLAKNLPRFYQIFQQTSELWTPTFSDPSPFGGTFTPGGRDHYTGLLHPHYTVGKMCSYLEKFVTVKLKTYWAI